MKKILFLFLLVFSILGLSSCNSKVEDNILNSSTNEDIQFFLYAAMRPNNRDVEFLKFYTDGTMEIYDDYAHWESVDGKLVITCEDIDYYYYMDKNYNLMVEIGEKRWKYKTFYYITTVYKVEDTKYQIEGY